MQMQNKYTHKRNKASEELSKSLRRSYQFKTSRESSAPKNIEQPPPKNFRQTLGCFQKRNSLSIGCEIPFIKRSDQNPMHVSQNRQTIFNLRNSLSELQSKLALAKESLRSSKKILSRHIISEEECQFEEDEPIFQLNSVIQSDISQKHVDSTINLESQKKLLFSIKSKEDLYHNLSRIKTYYLSEMAKGIEGQSEAALDHLNISLKVIKNKGKIDAPLTTQILKKKLNLEKREQDWNKKTLVLDIDETILHCQEQRNSPEDIQISIDLDNGEMAQAYISIRPYAITFLKRMAKIFEIIIFTASHQSYADIVLDQIDPDRELIRHRLYRDNCIQIHQNIYAKDLRVINRDLRDMVLVDNAPYSYIFQLDNGIPIIPYYRGQDSQLPALERYLQQLSRCSDVRDMNKKTFKLEKYNNFEQIQELFTELYLKKQ